MAKTDGISARGYGLTGRQVNLFPSGTRFLNEAGRFKPEFTPFAMRGKYSEYSRYRIDPSTKKGMTSRAWVTKKSGVGGGMTMKGLMNHLRIARYNVEKSATNFAVVLSLRAQKIFQESFKYKRFYSKGGLAWSDLTEKTKKNRIKRGTWPMAKGKGTEGMTGGILQEFGDLYRSIKQRTLTNGGQVYTDPAEFKPHPYGKRIKHSKCYAAIHNNGSEMGFTYGNGFGGKRPIVPAKKRQFMGHSTYLFEFARSIMRIYLFDDVFVTPKARK